MVPLAVFGIFAVLMSTGVECGYSSASSGSGSNSDGSGQTFTATNNNGHGQFSHTQSKPGGGGFTHTGNAPGAYGPSNFGQPGFGFQYSPGFSYGPFGVNQPQYQPFPQNFGFNAPFAPLPPFQPIQPISPFGPFHQPLQTPQEFNQYLNGLQQQYAAGGSVAQSTPGATAFASSYLGPTKYYKQQQELLNSWKNAQYVPGYGNVGGNGPNYAYASGAYGPSNQFHQTAGVFPPNKNKPNLDTRFDANDNSAGNNPGFFGISTSSFSSSSDVNGIKKHKEAATTSINDNGKVTTYNVEN